MSNPIRELKRVLSASQAPVYGTVERVQAGTVSVRTAGGLQQAGVLPGDATQYRPGDRVSISGGYVRGRRANTGVYVV